MSDNSEITFSDWNENEPSDDDSSENCVATSGGKWNDQECDDATIVDTIVCQGKYQVIKAELSSEKFQVLDLTIVVFAATQPT